MWLAPLEELTWAYQLHYYLCFNTYRRKQLFEAKVIKKFFLQTLLDICERHEYHVLESQFYPSEFRCLLSLRPEHSVSKVVQTLKANSSRQLGLREGCQSQCWAVGFVANSTGRMGIQAVRHYLAQQAEHHGYDARVLPPVYHYRESNVVTLTASHCAFDLNHHLVFSTYHRRGVFTSNVGRALGNYWLKVAAKKGFAIDQMTIVPDHVHLLVRIVPRMSIESCALSLMNNGQHFVSQYFPQYLISSDLPQLWQPSAYAGTCGNFSTALIKHWLG